MIPDSVIDFACLVLFLAIVLILAIVWQAKSEPQRQRKFPPADSSRVGARGVELFIKRSPGGWGWRAKPTQGIDPGEVSVQPGSDSGPSDSSGGGHGGH